MERKEKLFIWLIAISAVTLLTSNLLATKLTVFAGIAVDCGIILYPVSYIVGDLTVEFFGKKRANLVLYVSAMLTLVATIFFTLAIFLPAYPGWAGAQAFAEVFAFAPRIVLGSTAAYLLSGLLNNLVFEQIRQRYREKLALRILGSSVLAHAVDSLVFETIAFFGVLSFREFLAQALFAYVAGLALECLLYHLATRPAHNLMQYYLREAP